MSARRTTWWQRFSRRRDEGGYAAILVAVVVSTIGIGAAAVAIDTGQWYVEVQRVQKAADAAALAGVPFLPQDFANAKARALEVARINGYDDGSPTVTVDVAQGSPATQLEVTVTSRIDNQFGAALGVGNTTISRSATADYQGPAPMGSPCNTFGNEPDPGGGDSSPRPTGSAQGSNVPVNCSRTPEFWANVEGPETGKVQGDRYQTRTCESNGVDGCTGTTNDEYDPFGYVFVVKVQKSFFNADGTAKGPVDLQLYDPAFLDVGQTCAELPAASNFSNNSRATNPWVINSDARSRYSRNGTNTSDFCTGDTFVGSTSGNSNGRIPTTSFVLRQQTDTLNPKLASVQSGVDFNGVSGPCIQQFSGSNPSRSGGYVRDTVFQEGNSRYDNQIAQSFHNWMTFCRFTPPRPGDYYLQVRSNVSMGGVVDGIFGRGNSAAAALTGNTTTGGGSNAFSVRAVTPAGLERGVAVSGNDHMPIYVNADTASPTFNLIRVLPGAAGQKISFSYFDAGDAQAAGGVQVLMPLDATGINSLTRIPTGCTTYGGSADTASAGSPLTLPTCLAPIAKSFTSDSSKNNGRTQTITIPIPTDYSCNFVDFNGCWWRVNVTFGSGRVTDVTTWDATIEGDPVRLVE